jgi:hypothetical protein
MRIRQLLRLGPVVLLSVWLTVGCVTRTERVAYYPHLRSEDESVFDELRREFGWKKSTTRSTGDPFYKRATREIKETVSGWFHPEPSQPSELEREKERLRFEAERQEALRRVREQQESEE